MKHILTLFFVVFLSLPAVASDETSAIITAISGPNWLKSDENFSVAGQVAQAGDSEAAAFSFHARVKGGLSVNGSVAVGMDTTRTHSRLGFRYGW